MNEENKTEIINEENNTENEVILEIDEHKNNNNNIEVSHESTNKVSRGNLEIDMEEYVDISSLGKDETNEKEENTNEPTHIMNENVTIDRNKMDSTVVDFENINNAADLDGDGEVTQEEHDENINQTTKLNEAGKKEIRMEVDERVTLAHEKDRKVSKLVVFILIVVLVIIGFFIRRQVINSKYDLLVREVKTAAEKYLGEDANASSVYALYSERVVSIEINVYDLKRKGYLDDVDLTNPKTGEDMTNTKVVVTLDGGKMVYTYPSN